MNSRLGDITIASATEQDLSLVEAVTGLGPRVVRRRAEGARGNTLIRNVFGDEWPYSADALGSLTVAVARDAGLVPEIAHVTGLSDLAVTRRLNNTHGKTLVVNAFEELPGDEANDDEEQGDADDTDDDATEDDEAPDDGDFDADDPLALLGAVRVAAIRRARDFLAWLAAAANMEGALLQRRVSRTHGNTRVSSLLGARWPVQISEGAAEVLGTLRASAVRRSPPLAAWVALEFQVDRADVEVAVEEADGNALIRNVLAPAARTRRPKGYSGGRATQAPVLRASDVVDGRWRVVKHLGTGGFGSVYEVVDLRHPKMPAVVLKLASGEDAEKRLQAELEIGQQLDRDSICTYRYDNRVPGLGTYAILAHAGRSLDTVIATRRVLPVLEAIEIVTRVADALDYAHDKNVLHQDVKPANIMIADGVRGAEVRLGDFGISVLGRRTQRAAGGTTVMGTSAFGLTPAYAAPEQLLGLEPRRASDQYSLALVFCSMLEGKVFDARWEVRPFARLTEEQNVAVRRALDLTAERRFRSCGDFVRALGGSR